MMFAFRLCLALGFSHPDKLFREISFDQFRDWQTFYQLRPFGHEVDHSMIAKLISAWASSDSVPADFMPGNHYGRERADIDTNDPDQVAAAFGVVPLHRRAVTA